MEALINPNYNLIAPSRGHESMCATADQVENLGLAGITTTNVNGAEGRLVTNTNAVEGRLTTNVNGSEGRLVTNQNGAEARTTTERFGFENLNATRGESFENRTTTERFGFRNLDATERFGLYNSDKTEFYGLKNFEATKDALKDIMMQNCQDTAAIQLTATINAKDAALTAAVNAAAIAKQVAECCCEQRELTRAQGEETRNLINATTADNLRDKLQTARDEIIALRLRASLPPALTPAITI